MSDKTYNENVASKDEFKESLVSLGFDVKSYKEETYNGRKWLVYKGILNETNAIYAITQFRSSTTLQVTILNVGSRTDEVLLTELGEAIDKATLVQSGSGSGRGNGGSTTPSGPSPGSVSAFK